MAWVLLFFAGLLEMVWAVFPKSSYLGSRLKGCNPPMI